MGQNVTFFTSKQGLSNSCIRNMYEDSRHNIWVTTLNGLNRYDGVKMNVYRHDDNDSTSLGNDESTCVLEYDKNRIIVGTNTGAQVFDYATNRFKNIPVISGDTKSIVSPRIIRAFRMSNGKIYLCTAGYGCAEVSEDTGGNLTARQIDTFNTGDNKYPVQFFEDNKKNLWIVNSAFQLYRQTDKKKFKHYPTVNNVVKVCTSSSGRLYIGTINDGVYIYNEKSDSFTQLATGADCGIISSINSWTEGRIFICTDGGGLRVYDERTKSVSQSSIQVGDFNINTSNVKDAMSDSFGNIWIGIYLKGLMMKPVSQSRFEYVGRHSITKNSLGTNSVVSLTSADNGKMWVSTDNSGLYLLSPDGTSSEHFNPDEISGMPRNFTALYSTTNSSLLLGTFFDGLYTLQNKKFTLLDPNIKFVFDIQPADNGNLWFATMGDGMYYYNPHTKEYKHYGEEWNRTAKDNEKIGNKYMSCIRQVGKRLFVGTYDGLDIFDVNAGDIKNRKKLLLQIVITHIAEYKGKIWATTNKGLYGIDIKTLNTEHYTTEDGLPINSLKSIIAENDKLWIGTDNGLVCFNLKTYTCDNFFVADGLQDNEFSLRTALKANGKLYFGGISGLTYFDEKTIHNAQKSNQNMRLRLVDLLVDNSVVHVGDKSGSYDILTSNIDDGSEIHLAYTDNHISLQLCVDGILNQHITYEFCIDGGEWKAEDQNVNRLVFNNLEPGTYIIKLRARGFNTTSDERTVKIIVHAPWYASTLAKIIYLLLFICLVFFIQQTARRQIRARNVIMRHKQERELNEARIQFFMNISHEIRTPMTLILAPLEKLINTDKDETRQRNYKLMKQNSNRILRLINQLMDVRKIEQGKFQLEYKRVDLVKLLQNVFDVFVTNAQNRNITYEFKHEVDSLITFIDPDNIDKVVMNLLSNAFKFTPDKGKVTLELKEEGENFMLTVCDTGCGISDKEKSKIFDRFYSAAHKNGYIGTGIGLNLTSMLVHLHKGNISVKDNPEGTGTLFTVDMPIGNSSLVTHSVLPAAEIETKVQAPDNNESDRNSLSAPVLELDKASDIRNKRILLVEDDESIRQYIHSEFSSEFHIHECTNGQEAWDYIIAHPNKVNIVISDIMMPVMDGMTLCQKVKNNFTTNHIPLILMTALGSDADRIAGIIQGADAYVSKPFNIDILHSTVINLLKSRQLLQGKFNAEKKQEELLEKVDIASPDEQLMKRVIKCINANMDNPELSVEMIADQVGISRVHFYRKMKDLTGQSPRDYLKVVRLKEAARLIREKKNIDITGVSIAVGFKTLSGFSNNFKALFGMSPTEYAKEQQKSENKDVN